MATVDGFKLVSAANDILFKAKQFEEGGGGEEQMVRVTDIDEDVQGEVEEEQPSINVGAGFLTSPLAASGLGHSNKRRKSLSEDGNNMTSMVKRLHGNYQSPLKR